MTPRTTQRPETNGSIDLAGWKAGGNFPCMLPSGAEVIVRPLRIEHYYSFGRTPDYLRVIALGDLRDAIGDSEKVSPIDRAKAWEEFLVEYLKPAICQVVVSPAGLTPEDLADLPPEDVDFLGALVQRRVTEDARGRTLGIEPLDRWATFRDKHHCADDCASCAAVISEFSAAVG